MKVLLVAPVEKEGYSGGQARAGSILIDGLRRYCNTEVDLHHVVHPHRAEARSFVHALWLRVVLYSQCLWVLIRHRPDVLHIFAPCSVASIVEKTVLAMIAKVFLVRTLINLRNDPVPFFSHLDKFYRIVVRWCLGRFSGALCQFTLLRNFYVQEVGFSEDRIFVAYNAIDGVSIDISEELLSRRLQERRLIYLGSLQPRKGIDTLLTAISLIKEERRPILDIVGDPQPTDYMSELVAMANKLDVSNFVVFHGAKFGFEKFELLNEAMGLVLPSRAEGFPNVVLEAAQLGLPSILTNVGAAIDISKAYGGGAIQVEVDDPEALATSIDNLVHRPDEYPALAVAAASGVCGFGVKPMCFAVVSAYRSIMVCR